MLPAIAISKQDHYSGSYQKPFLGEERREHTLCSLMEYHNENMKTVLQSGTLKNYFTTARYVGLFLIQRYKTDDIYLTELNFQFITEFEFFLHTCKPLDDIKPLQNNGIMKHIERWKKMVTLATKMEWIPKDPFIRYKLRLQKTEMNFLTADELTLVESYSFKNPKLDRGRDLFVFSCYAGLCYYSYVK